MIRPFTLDDVEAHHSRIAADAEVMRVRHAMTRPRLGPGFLRHELTQ
ncbi:MAG: hypothetical protein M3O91_02420 [Chloroflexota bacterium]|nr:hypothetical protein [Chloroflexota bacterium]